MKLGAPRGAIGQIDLTALTATLAVTELALAVLLSLGAVDVPVALAVCVVAGVVSIAISLVWLHRDELAEPEQ